MRILILLAAAALAAAGDDWSAVQRLAPSQSIEVALRDGARARVQFLSATADAVSVREATGERSIERARIRSVRVADPGRRVRKGLMWTAIGGGIGYGAGFAICPHCPSEGAPAKFTAPFTALGAGIGALGFLSSPYRTIYKAD